MHQSYAPLEIEGIDTPLVINWEIDDVDNDYYIGDAHVFRTTREYRISSVYSELNEEDCYDFDCSPKTTFDKAVAAAYCANRFEP